MKDSSKRTITNDYKVNSKLWWDMYFNKEWDRFEGREQTKYFMQIIVQNLPKSLVREISKSNTILDWGCALGQGVDVLNRTFTNSKVTGLDFSSVAIKKAKKLYPRNNFYIKSLEEINRKFDCIFNSNCLEHYSNPISILKKHLIYTNQFYISLMPFEEKPRIESHKVTFYKESFPEKIGNFKMLFTKVINTSNSPYWSGNQILVVYARSDIENKIKDDVLDEMLEKNSELKNRINKVGFKMQNLERRYNEIVESDYFRLWQFYCRVRDKFSHK